jgi:hypothetical protein
LSLKVRATGPLDAASIHRHISQQYDRIKGTNSSTKFNLLKYTHFCVKAFINYFLRYKNLFARAFENSISVSPVAAFFPHQTLPCQVVRFTCTVELRAETPHVCTATGYDLRHRVRIPAGFGKVLCFTTMYRAPKAYYPLDTDDKLATARM